MTVRGFTWGYYVSDDGNTYAFRVDSDYFGMPERGWTGPAASGTFVYPRGWTPRKVIGIDSDGHKLFAYVATTTADLWTGAAATFTVYGTDELPHTYTVIQRLAERNRMRP
jgi:hypothetical protein